MSDTDVSSKKSELRKVVDSSVADQLLIESLIQRLLPELETALRDKLKQHIQLDYSKSQVNSLFDS